MELTSSILDVLEGVLLEEIQILRALLASLVAEQNALYEKKGDSLPTLIEERLFLNGRFDDFLDRLVEAAPEVFNKEQEWTPQQILERLQEVIEPENIELKSLCEQALALMQEMEKQNAITSIYTENEGMTLSPYMDGMIPQANPLGLKTAPKKTALEVMDPET